MAQNPEFAIADDAVRWRAELKLNFSRKSRDYVTDMGDGRTISDKIFKNTVFNTLGNLWKMGIGLVLTPYIISHVGIDRYGVWALVAILTGYFGLLDLGISASFIKYISEFFTRGETDNINKLVSTGIIFYSFFALLIIVLGYFSMGFILDLLHISQELRDEAFFVLTIGVVMFGLTNITSAFGAIQGGLQRMDLTNKINIFLSIPMVLGTVYFLENGYGLYGLTYNNIIIFMLTATLNIVVAFKLLPELRLGLDNFSLPMLKKLFRFGYKVQIGNIADTVTFQSDKLIIAYFLNMGLVGFYQIGSQVSQTIRSLPLLLISSLLPAASEIHASKDRPKLQELYIKGSKYLVFVSFPLTVFVLVMASTIMLVWMGPGYEQSVWILQILAIGYLANIAVGVAVTIGAATDRPEFQMNASLITIISNLVLSLILIKVIGFAGVAIATSISLILGPIYYFIVFHREIQMSLSKLLKDVAIVPVAASILPTLVIYVLLNYVTSAFAPSGRLMNLVVLGFLWAVFTGMYLLQVWLTRYFDQYDMDLMNRYIPIARVTSILGIGKKAR